MGFVLFLHLPWHWHQRNPAPSLVNPQEVAGRASMCWVCFPLGFQWIWWIFSAWRPSQARAPVQTPALPCERREGGRTQSCSATTPRVLQLHSQVSQKPPFLPFIMQCTGVFLLFSCLFGIFFPDGQWSPKARNKVFSVFWVYYIF